MVSYTIRAIILNKNKKVSQINTESEFSEYDRGELGQIIFKK